MITPLKRRSITGLGFLVSLLGGKSLPPPPPVNGAVAKGRRRFEPPPPFALRAASPVNGGGFNWLRQSFEIFVFLSPEATPFLPPLAVGAVHRWDAATQPAGGALEWPFLAS